MPQLDGLEAAAVDYLLKPVEIARLTKCIERLSAQLSRGSADVTVSEMATRIAELLGSHSTRGINCASCARARARRSS